MTGSLLYSCRSFFFLVVLFLSVHSLVLSPVVHGEEQPLAGITSLSAVGNRVLAGTRGLGLIEYVPGEGLFSQNDGLDFIYPPSHFAVTDLVADPVNASLLYASFDHGYVVRSEDGGETWHYRATLVGVSSIEVLSVDPNDGNRLYAGTDTGIFLSDNRGQTWYPASGGRYRLAIGDIAIDPLNTDNVYAAGYETGLTDRGWLLYSRNGGRDWSLRELPCAVNRVVIDPLDQASVYVANVGIGTSSGRCPLISTDYGAHFSFFSPDLGEYRMNDLGVSGSGVLFVATDSGILFYDGQRGAWTDTGITHGPATRLLLSGTTIHYSTPESFGWYHSNFYGEED